MHVTDERRRLRTSSGDLRRTVRLFRTYMGGRRVYVAGLVLLTVEALSSVLEPWPIAYLIDYLQGARPPLREQGGPALLDSPHYETILVLTLAIVAIAAINSAADSLTEVFMARGGRSLGYSIRVSMYSHLQRLSLGYHDKRRTGDVLTRVTGDVLVLEDFVVKSISNILGSLLVLVGSFAFLLYQSWRVALVALVIVPVLALVSNHYSRRIKVASKTQRDREGDLASTAQEMLTSIRLVQSYGRGTVDLEQFSDQTAKSMRASLAAANIQAQFSFAIALMEALAISAVIWLGVWLFDRGALTIGTLVLFVLLLQNMFKPARKIVSEWYKIGKVFASTERIDDLLQREVVVRDLHDAVPAPPFTGRLTFDNVTFAYPAEHTDGTPLGRRAVVLDGVSFQVAPGEVVALAGHSGAGKSTIAQLVPRLYDPDEGEVLIDGHPLRSLTLSSLRRQVSLVLQETVLLSGTVAENIGYGIADATAEQIEAAARMANAHDFIMEMPEGYQTMLGERGSTLSGGQRQRLAIARAFIRHAPILILDEPTTGLDAESAQSVIGALRSLMQGTTTIVISHDPGLIRCADRVLLIGEGRILDEGPPEKILARAELDPGLVDLPPVRATGVPPRSAVAGTTAGRAVPSIPVTSAPRTSRLTAALRDRLPGLESALDPERASERVRGMLSPDCSVASISVGHLWLRDETSCNVRYEVALRGEAAPMDPVIVLGRVHQDAAAAASYATEVAALPTAADTPPPWRRSTHVVEEAALALSRFPLDPQLPTLPLVTDGAVLNGLEPFAGSYREPAVTVVHYPREGSCVLRYRRYRSPAHSHHGAAASVYGKVYAGAGGVLADGFLRALLKAQRQHNDELPAAFPNRICYDPELRLLLTASLPGTPRVPALLKSWLAAGVGDGTPTAELRRLLRESAQALAGLHGSDLATAPVYTAAHEIANLEHELAIVRAFWPEEAERVMSCVEAPPSAVDDPDDIVLSHGDFTPSQVLLDGPVPAVVDLDTLCWADPAFDLGRYLAHLHLLARKAGGPGRRERIDGLGGEFLRGYAEVSTRTSSAAVAADRIAFYMATSLARSALHSCRQLKPERFEVALSLLQEVQTRRVQL
jgi:ABC-type multidrug transport system fused ATPase/permease subunit